MKKIKRGIAVLLLISVLFSINVSSVFATDALAEINPKVYDKGTNTLNLEGSFAANGSDGAIWVKDGAQLTINGTNETEVHGTLGADKYSMAVWAKTNETKVVINGGYYTNETDGSERGTDLIYASEGAQIEINGGKFEAAKTEWTLNCQDHTTSKITVKGGTFYKFDPSNTTVGEGEIVVPDGYGVVKNGDWYTVVNTVYNEGTNTLNLVGELTANGSNGAIWVKDGAQLTINGTDETEVHGTLGTDNYSMAVWAKTNLTKVVINGGYYTNETDGSERGTDLIYASEGAQIEINGGKFEAAKTEWTLNCQDHTTSKITVKGGTFYKFDPSNTTVGEGEIVVPDGYIVAKNGDWYTVCKEDVLIDYIVPGVSETENEEIKQTINSSIKEKNPELAEDIATALQNGEKVTIAVEINKLEKDNVNEEEKQMILQTVKENQEVYQYLDISVAVRTEDKLLGNVPQLTGKIRVFVDIPEDLIKDGRKFFILKLHDGEVEQINGELNGTRLEIEVDQFSTFALAYEDVETSESSPAEPQPPTAEKDETPKTGVISVSAFVWVAIAAIALVAIVNTKKSSKHSK